MQTPPISVSTAGRTSLHLARALRVAADNLDAVGVDLVRVVELEVDVLDDEGPDVVAEAVRVEVALEGEAALDLVRETVGDGLIEVDEDFHGAAGKAGAAG